MITSPPPAVSKPRQWRSLAELHEDPEFLKAVEREFPKLASFWDSRASRRTFLSRMAASFALAGLSGCVRQPEETIVPAVEVPKQVPGRPLMFATSMPVPGGALGLLVESHDGRPTKIEGNPLHPASLGATDAFAQAEILNLYDPDRSQVIRERGEISSWDAFLTEAKPRLDAHRSRQGRGLHILTGGTTSPTLLGQLAALLQQFPQAVWYEYDAATSRGASAAPQATGGQNAVPHYRLERADVIFSLDADFLTRGPAAVRMAREFSDRRQASPSAENRFNRLYVVEPSPTLTGAAADHRLSLRPSRLAPLMSALAKELGAEEDAAGPALDESAAHWVQVLAGDLQTAGSRAIVIVGDHQPPELQALGMALNSRLGAVGTTVTLARSPGSIDGHSPATLADLTRAIDNKSVETLVILGANPAYGTPSDLQFASKLRQVSFVIHHGLYFDETARLAGWHVPAAHFLELWSDARAEDGTTSIVQPLIAPLYDGKSQHELLNVLLDRLSESGYDTVRNHWRGVWGESDFDRAWGQSLHDGVVVAALPAEGDAIREAVAASMQATLLSPGLSQGEVEIVFRPDPTLLDGRYANNGWLQELPKPFTKETWGNAAWVSPATADGWKIQDGDVVEFSHGAATIAIPVVRVPGQPDGVVTLHLGSGRTHGGRNADGVGVDVSPLRTSDQLWFTTAMARPTGKHVELARTQHHFLMEGRDLVKTGTVEEFLASPDDPHFMHSHQHASNPDATLYSDWKQEGPQWGMSINLSACTGCNACVIACQSENNIPVVGPEQVRNHREMHWLRIDTYYSGEEANSEVHHQPVMCMHCEHAPCEPVCPVAATTHSGGGLNEMTYNRCIGTRYCSNNCPYKVRRFNFLDYHADLKELPVLQLAQNPDVTVRERGVMEKCTYCVQRISAARIAAEIDGREIADGEIVTACQAVCPSRAIVFGNIADAASQVARAKDSPLKYGLLDDLNTRPRTTYLAALKNPNRALLGQEEHA